MTCRRSCGPSVWSTPSSFTTSNKTVTKSAFFAIFLLAAACFAQDPSQANDPSADQAREIQPASASATVTVPAGTRLALVLTHPIESRVIHRGDDIYAQTSSPVDSGNEVVIPAGTFVRGVVDKLGRNGGRGELRLQSMSIIFPDGYVASVPGPITLESNEGYAIKDPGSGRAVAALALPAAGAGLGALIGHSVGKADSTVTTTLPPGCIAPSPFCLTSNMPVFGTKGKDAIIGAGIGSAIGAIAL